MGGGDGALSRTMAALIEERAAYSLSLSLSLSLSRQGSASTRAPFPERKTG